MSMIGNLTAIPSNEFAALAADPSALEAALCPEEGSDPDVFLYKSWHTVHYWLNGDEWGGTPPLKWAVLCDQEAGEDFSGYGPARYLTPEQVGQVATALEKLTPEELTAGFVPADFAEAEIYSFNEDDAETEAEEALRLIDEMKAFYRKAASAGDVVVFWLY